MQRYLNVLNIGDYFRVAIKFDDGIKAILIKAGFTEDFATGEKILPSIQFGKISTINAEGTYKKRKDLEMETVYRQIEWNWKDWGGNEHSDIVDIPYKRYPREYTLPPSIELQILESPKLEEKIIASDLILYDESNYELIKHTINLFLEIFRVCIILKKDLAPVVKNTKIVRLNWEVLPKGRYPWDKSKRYLDSIIGVAKRGHQPVIRQRFEIISKANPDFLALGKAGFHGYVVFGFSKKNIFILESIHFGNATYIFENDWECLSQMTKAEILNNNFQKDRLIHKNGWKEEVEKYIK